MVRIKDFRIRRHTNVEISDNFTQTRPKNRFIRRGGGFLGFLVNLRNVVENRRPGLSTRHEIVRYFVTNGILPIVRWHTSQSQKNTSQRPENTSQT